MHELHMLLGFLGFLSRKRVLFGREMPLLCGGFALLSHHELCRIYVLFWSGFGADFCADIEDFLQISAQKMLIGSPTLKFLLAGPTQNCVD